MHPCLRLIIIKAALSVSTSLLMNANAVMVQLAELLLTSINYLSEC